MLKFGTLEGRPVVITNSDLGQGYWLIAGKWVRMTPGLTTQVGLRTEAEFEKRFPDLPALRVHLN
jgi:hypothetical protein